MDKVRTVSDTKRDFYTYHTRPVNSVYRRIVEELLVEMHLLCVNQDFQVEPIYCLGVVTAFERFLQGYQPQQDKESIFAALCQSVGGTPQQYWQEADTLLTLAKQKSPQELIAQIDTGGDKLSGALGAIANKSNFKYSRLFAIGLYTILLEAEPELGKNESKRNEILKQVAEVLHIPSEKMQKDLELYRSNLDKMEQLLGVIEESLQAERKKRTQQEV